MDLIDKDENTGIDKDGFIKEDAKAKGKVENRNKDKWWLDSGKIKRDGLYEELVTLASDRNLTLKQIQEHFDKRDIYISTQTIFKYRKLAAKKAEKMFSVFLNITDKLKDLDEEMDLVKDRIHNIKREIKSDRDNFELVRGEASAIIKKYVPSDELPKINDFLFLATSPDKIKLEQLLNDYLATTIKLREFTTKYQFDKILQLYTNYMFKFVFEQVVDLFFQYIPADKKKDLIDEFKKRVQRLAESRIGDLAKELR